LPALAIKAADLEAFRESMYLAKVVEAAAEPEPLLLAHTSNMCSWCGIWQPLPSLPTDSTGELGSQPTVAFSAAVAEPIRLYSDPDKNTTARDIEAAIDYIFQDIEDTSVTATPHPADIIDLADLLSPSLCDIVSSYEGANQRDMLKELRGQRVAAFTARAAQGSKEVSPDFSRLSIDVSKYAFCMTQPSQPQLFSRPVSNPLYKKDEATGECKQQ